MTPAANLTLSGTPLLALPTTNGAGNTPDSIAVLQLSTGGEDVLVANFYSNTVSVFTSNGNGTFSHVTDLPTGSGPNGFALGDFGNGYQDFAVANYNDDTVTVYLGDGIGNFTQGPTLSNGSGPANEMAIGDFAGNGNLDLATANENDGTVSVFMGNGDGTFQNAVTYNVGVGVDAITAGDFQGNGQTDLAVANYNTSAVTVLTNNGDGTFTVGSPIAVGANPWYITAGEFNGNGADDIATANYGGNSVSVLLSNGDGTFQSAVNYNVGSNPTGIVAADINGDGRIDLLTSNYGSNDASVLLGNGDGTFQSAGSFAAGSGPNGLAIGDFTNSPNPGVVVADQNGNGFASLLNQSLQGTAGQSFSGVLATVTDADGNAVPGAYSATVSWGDGQTSVFDSSAFTENADGTFSLSGAHTYTGPGNYTIGITVNDSDGNTGAGSTNAIIADAFLTIQSTPPNFAPAGPDIPVGATPDSVFATQLDGSGTPYLLEANYGDGTITVLRGDGTGNFQAIGTYAVGAGPNGFAVGYFNGDGNPDVAVADFESNQVSILLGNGDGTLQSAVNYAVGSGPADLTMGDFAGNGNLDLATANFNDGTVSVLMGNGNGTFQSAATYQAGPGAVGVVAGDFNNDGSLDLATANYGNNTVSILLNNGDGTFAAPVNYAVGGHPWFIAAGDLVGNGVQDLVTANFDGGVSVLLGNGDGTFQNAVQYAAGANPTAVAIADVTGDEIPDLIVSNYGSNNVSILVGNGDGTFQAPIDFNVGSGPNGVTVGDLTGNDNWYIATANQNSNDVSILVSQTFQADQGQPFSAVLASVADENPYESVNSLSAVVNWGDGTTSELGPDAFTPNSSGGWDINAQHMYLSSGLYDGTIEVFDQGGSANATTFIAHVVSDPTSTGTVTVNGFNNSTTAIVTYNDGAGNAGTENTLLTQFNVTYSSGGSSTTFNTFCEDLEHTVTVGQTYAVNPQGDEATAFTNGSRIAFILANYGAIDLTNNPDQAAAVQIAIWDLSLNNHNPTSFGLDADGTYSSGDESVFNVNLGSNPDAAHIAALTNQYLAASTGSTLSGSWLNAAAAGTVVNRGQSLLTPLPPELLPVAPPACMIDPLLVEMKKQLVNMQAAFALARLRALLNPLAPPLPDPSQFVNYQNLQFLFNKYLKEQTAKQLPDKVQQRVQQLILQLGDPSFTNREAAQEALIDIGYGAYSLVAQATLNPDPETQKRATAVLEAYQMAIGEQIAVALNMCYPAQFNSARMFYWSNFKATGKFPFPTPYTNVFAPQIP